MSVDVDYAHTREAERRRAAKASLLAATARRLGLMAFELRTIGGTEADASRLDRVRREAGLDRAPSTETWVAALTRLERFALEVPGIGLCPDCDWPVLEVVTEVGRKKIQIDPFPREDGTVLPVRGKDGINMLARIFTGGDPHRPIDEPLYRQHARSCPQSAHGRRIRAPRCSVCGNPLHGPLAAVDPTYKTHPTCDPQEVSPMTTTTTAKPRATRRKPVPASEPATISKAAAAALMGEHHDDEGRVLRLDPHTLTLDENARKDVGMTAEFAADVADRGVLVPLMASRDAVGQLLVWDGQRRLVAALEANNDVNATVPVVVTAGFGDGEERLSTQDRVNHHRAALTVKDQVAVYEQLSLMGRSAESIAKKQKRPLAEVKAALAVIGSKAAVQTAQEEPTITLDQLAVIAEFDDDDEIQKDLRVTATQTPGRFEHLAQQHRDNRAWKQAKATGADQLEAAGVPIITEAWYSLRGGAELTDLRDKPGGKVLTEAAHRSCPGHAGLVEVRRDGDGLVPRISYGCTGWAKHGHAHRYKSATSTPSKDLPEQAAAAKAERRAVRENNKASESATTVRRRFVIDLLQRKTLPDDAPQIVALILDQHRDEDYGARAVVDLLLGGKGPKSAELGKSKHTALAFLLAATFARVEAGMGGNYGKDWWRRQDATRVAYLNRLQSWGYGLSDLEAAYVKNKVKDLVL